MVYGYAGGRFDHMNERSNEQREAALRQLAARYEASQKDATDLYLSPEQFEELLLHYYNAGDYQQTLNVAEAAIDRFSFSPDFYRWKALIHKINLDEKEAMDTLEKLEVYAPHDEEVMLLRLEIYVHFNYLVQARSVLEQLLAVVKEDTKVSLLAFYEGLIYLQEDSAEEAFKSLTWSVRLDPWQEAALDELLNAEQFVDYAGRIGKFLHRMLEKEPFVDILWYYLGLWCCDAGMDGEALEAYGYARSLNPDRAGYELEYADKLFDLERYDEALDSYHCYFRHPEAEDSYETFMRVGRCHQLSNRTKEARKYFMQALELGPDMYDVYEHLGECYVADEQWAMAAFYYGRATEQPGHTSDCWLGLALCNSAIEENFAAEEAFLRAVAMDPNFSDAHVTYSLFLADQGREQEAIEQLEIKLSQYRDAPLLYGTVAVLLMCNRRKLAFTYLHDALSEYYDDHYMLLDWNAQLVEDPQVKGLLEYFRED